MPKGRKKNPSGGRKRQNSALRQHRQVGKILTPPLMNLPAPMQQIPWLRDTFPDMLWLSMLITEHGTAGMRMAVAVLDRMVDVIRETNTGVSETFVLTGQLTAFEQVPESARPTIIEALRSDGLFEQAVPWTFARALMKYRDLPGSWLFEGWNGNEQIVSADEPERLLAKIIRDHLHGQSPSATRVKFMVMVAWMKSGRLHIAPNIADEWGKILPRYPDDITEEERKRIEPSIRATFMSFASLDFQGDGDESQKEQPSVKWAQVFWRTNWKLYRCELPVEDTDADASSGDHREAIDEAQREWQTELDELSAKFLAVARGVEPDLYAPDKHEVLTGMVYRALRDLSVMINYPALWTGEHGSSYIRGLVESRIVLKWLAQKNDAALYARFKSYGRGRLKLFKLHMEEYRDGLADPPSDIDSYIEHLDALVNQDIWEEFQEISIEGNFAGVDTRRMADQVGMLTEYRLVFAPASASVHGEWTALDKYALAVCKNPLHRMHRIARPKAPIMLGPELVESALLYGSNLVDDYVSAWPPVDGD